MEQNKLTYFSAQLYLSIIECLREDGGRCLKKSVSRRVVLPRCPDLNSVSQQSHSIQRAVNYVVITLRPPFPDVCGGFYH